MTRTTPQLARPLQTSAPHQWEDVWPLTYDLTGKRPTYTAILQWNQVSNLEPSGSEAETLQLGHRDPEISMQKQWKEDKLYFVSRLLFLFFCVGSHTKRKYRNSLKFPTRDSDKSPRFKPY
ncbi:hypothetical protein AVEN_176902-1 [Araneus ventricosus]|uniref:Uncharacterized protein n=1 Tax=Araneus ventricosus TaxID=182803 RepID=A0A4Y2ND93_ARAVE|nr:hypothetical protein AVEN_176902-1 [Araneus ventricosus]